LEITLSQLFFIDVVLFSKDEEPKPWSLYSWKSKPIKHQPTYSDKEELSAVLQEIESTPKIVEVQDICILQSQLKK